MVIDLEKETGLMSVRKDNEESSSEIGEDGKADWVKVVWVDLNGIQRARFVRKGRETRAAKVCWALGAHADVPAANQKLGMAGEFAIRPAQDARFFSLPGWNLNDCKSQVAPQVLADVYNDDGSSAPVCGRSVLRQAQDRMREQGLEVQLGFEIEFVLLRESDHSRVDKQVYATSAALEANQAVLVEMAMMLTDQGVLPLQFHGESAHGQYEFSFPHRSALRAVDDLIVAKHVIRHVAGKHGLVASFLPKLGELEAGNSTHCHVGFVDADTQQDAFGQAETRFGMSEKGEQFLAGVFNHLAALLALTTSSDNSFRRMQPGCWAGAYHVWGVDNRECPLRLIQHGDKSKATNFEIKSFDATANPYLGAAGIIYAGLHGLSPDAPHVKLPTPCSVDPKDVSSSTRLPVSLLKAALCFEKDEYLTGCFDPLLVSTVLALRRADHETFVNLELSDQVQSLFALY